MIRGGLLQRSRRAFQRFARLKNRIFVMPLKTGRTRSNGWRRYVIWSLSLAARIVQIRTAGASAPEALAQAVIQRLRELGVKRVRLLQGVEETISFPLPRGL